MIKLIKPKRYANICKISSDSVFGNDISLLKKKVNIIGRLPKNTLRCKFVNFQIGRMHDDFVKNLLTLKAEFEIIRFKR